MNSTQCFWKHIYFAVYYSIAFSSTRIDDSSEIGNISEIKETDSDAQIEALVKEFSASLTSVKQHIDESRKVRTEIEQDTKPEVTINETSVWSGDGSISEKSVKSNNTLNDVNQIDTNFEVVDDISELTTDVPVAPDVTERLYWTCYAKDSVEESVEIDQNVLTNNDIDDENSNDHITTIDHSTATIESDITQSSSEKSVTENIPKPSGKY